MMVDGIYADENTDDKNWDETWVSGNYYTGTAPGTDDKAKVNSGRGTLNRGICPPGWHVPTDYEWAVLLNKVDGVTDIAVAGTGTSFTVHNFDCKGVNAGKLLKSSGTGTATDTSPTWMSNAGSDLYGFRALPAGSKANDNLYFARGEYAFFITSTAWSVGAADARSMHRSYDCVYRTTSTRAFGINIRCVRGS
jgi:uncharacterized protein (TIGR02145 family)